MAFHYHNDVNNFASLSGIIRVYVSFWTEMTRQIFHSGKYACKFENLPLAQITKNEESLQKYNEKRLVIATALQFKNYFVPTYNSRVLNNFNQKSGENDVCKINCEY